MKIAIVTGGLGFIGTHLISEIANKYNKIIVVDNLSPAVHQNRKYKSSNHYELVRGEVQKPETWVTVSGLLPPEDFTLDVFHLAADTSTGNSINLPSEHVSTNILGTAVLCEFLATISQNLNRIVLTSTRAVYGEGLWTTSNGELVNPEPRAKVDLENQEWNPKSSNKFCLSPIPISSINVKPNPVNIYGATKLSQEYILSIWCKAFAIKLQIFRLQNVYGPGQSLWNSYSGVISLFVKNALLGETIEVYEGGEIVRDLVFVKDVVKILGEDVGSGTQQVVLDVGSGLPSTLYEVALTITEYCKAEMPIVSNKYRIGDVRGIFADNSLLFGHIPSFKFTPLENGISELVRWARLELGSLGEL